MKAFLLIVLTTLERTQQGAGDEEHNESTYNYQTGSFNVSLTAFENKERSFALQTVIPPPLRCSTVPHLQTHLR